MDDLPFSHRRNLARRLLCDDGQNLTRKAGSFLGQLIVDPAPLTPAQADWFATLLERGGLSPETQEASHG